MLISTPTPHFRQSPSTDPELSDAPGVEAISDDSVDAALRRVGTTVLGDAVPTSQVEVIQRTIVEALGLRPVDHVLDLGCGNGLITAQIVPHAARITGIDVAPALLAHAERFHAHPKISYLLGDLTQATELEVPSASRAYTYGVLQHLEGRDLAGLLTWFRGQSTQPSVVFVGGVPDAARIRNFYDTPARWSLYERNRAAGTEQIGHWWTMAELAECAEHAGFATEIRAQNMRLYTGHYRFDAVLTEIR